MATLIIEQIPEVAADRYDVLTDEELGAWALTYDADTREDAERLADGRVWCWCDEEDDTLRGRALRLARSNLRGGTND